MTSLAPILLLPGGRAKPPPVVVVPPPVLPAVCWDRVQLITSGFNTPAQWYALTGIWRDVRSIVWHDMEGWLAGSIARWNTGAAGAHLCILRDGTVVLTCPLEYVAWHAGTTAYVSDQLGRTAFWRRTNINPYSVGIELEGFAATGYTPAQAASARRVTDWLTAKYNILRARTFDLIDGHHAHAEISATRSDPGPLFSWDWVL